MNAPAEGTVVWQMQPLTRAMRALVEAGGSSGREAQLVAENLVLANACGHDSHGVGMLPRYVHSLQDGGLRVNQHVQIQVDTGSLVVRQMTAEERVKYAESPQAAAERQSRRARKRS